MKKELAEKEHQLSVKPTEKAADSELSWLNVLSQETGENVQERINLQKALFELEETNKRNRLELQHLDDAIARHQVCNLPDQFQICYQSIELGTPKGMDCSREPLWICVFPFSPFSLGKTLWFIGHLKPPISLALPNRLPRQLFGTYIIV